MKMNLCLKQTEMYKINDKVKIMACVSCHEFEIGHIGTITRVKTYSDGEVIYQIDDNWWVEESEIDPA